MSNELLVKSSLSIAAAARVAGVSRATIKLWIRKHGLASYQFPGSGRQGICRIPVDALETFKERYRRSLTPETARDGCPVITHKSVTLRKA